MGVLIQLALSCCCWWWSRCRCCWQRQRPHQVVSLLTDRIAVGVLPKVWHRFWSCILIKILRLTLVEFWKWIFVKMLTLRLGGLILIKINVQTWQCLHGRERNRCFFQGLWVEFLSFLCIAHCKTTTLHEIHSICRAAIGLGNTDIYSVTDIFVQNLNTKSDQWNTAKPLEVPLNYF